MEGVTDGLKEEIMKSRKDCEKGGVIKMMTITWEGCKAGRDD